MFTLKPVKDATKPPVLSGPLMLMKSMGFDPTQFMSMFEDGKQVISDYVRKADENHSILCAGIDGIEEQNKLLVLDIQALRSELQDARIEILTRIQAAEERLGDVTPAAMHDISRFPLNENQLTLGENGEVLAVNVPVDEKVLAHYKGEAVELPTNNFQGCLNG